MFSGLIYMCVTGYVPYFFCVHFLHSFCCFYIFYYYICIYMRVYTVLAVEYVIANIMYNWLLGMYICEMLPDIRYEKV